jgi:hypothetical protein
MTRLVRYWITFDYRTGPQPTPARDGARPTGFGVTGLDQDDAIKIISSEWFQRHGLDLPPIREVVEDVDVATLDEHVRTNIHPPNWRGLWSPPTKPLRYEKHVTQPESFRVTAWLGEPSLLPWTALGPMSRFAWIPIVGVGRLTVQAELVQFEPSRLLRSMWRKNDVRSVELRPSEASVREIGPSDFSSNTIYSPILGSLLARVAFLREPNHVELQIGVADRERLLDLLDRRGWSVKRYTKTIWPWQASQSSEQER